MQCEVGKKKDHRITPDHRSSQAIWATLGVGAAYVPIDPEYPIERIKHILENAQPKLMLCREEKRQLIQTAAAAAECDIFTTETWPEQGKSSKSSIEQIEQAPPLHLAYIIYTSGSTGKPKAGTPKSASELEEVGIEFLMSLKSKFKAFHPSRAQFGSMAGGGH